MLLKLLMNYQFTTARMVLGRSFGKFHGLGNIKLGYFLEEFISVQ